MHDYLAGFVISVLSLLIGSVIRPVYEGYWKRRGEMMAERIYAAELEADRSRARQPVDQENAVHKAALDAKNQLRTAAIELRLQAHQEAFSHWRQLFRVYNSVDVTPTVIAAQEWWEKNCLYLEPDAREALSEAWALASLAPYRMRGGPIDNETAAQFKEDFRRFHAAGDRILQAVALPPMASAERQAIDGDAGEPQ
ncbi:hypothetical protein [Achromobacter denitrificans]|uniref:hypothetical protein n=1 Tax=Achromobacter denitrificans TaxID=32002 RepID=UPI00240D3FBE|nr:hypothetical protein [Achromobacter denitrificans]